MERRDSDNLPLPTVEEKGETFTQVATRFPNDKLYVLQIHRKRLKLLIELMLREAKDTLTPSQVPSFLHTGP